MEVSVYKTHFEVELGINMSINDVLARIKNKEQNNHLEIINKLRQLPSQEEEKDLKKKLPLICFSGTFSKRTDNDCIKHSGLICLDFDDESFDTIMQRKEYIYAAFISPTATGVKVLVKIPEVIKDHGDYYLSLANYFGLPSIDEKCKNISRGCYLSYDANLYHNPDAPVFYRLLPKNEVKYEKSQSRNPYYVTSNDKIVERLINQHKHEFYQTNRNHACYILACEFNRFGIVENEALQIMQQFIEPGFAEAEIKRTIKSAYLSNAHEFKTKRFTDSTIVNKTYSLLKNKFTKEEIKEKLKKEDGINDDVAETALNAADEELKKSLFWSVNKLGHVIIDNNLLNKWYENTKLSRYMINDKDWIMIIDDNCKMREVSVADIKGYIRDYMEANKEYCQNHIRTHIMRKLNKEYLKEDMLEWLPPIDIKWLRDSRDTAYFFYQNTWIKIDAKGYYKIEENDKVGGYIWQDQIIKRDITVIDDVDRLMQGEFLTFIWNITTGINTERFEELSTLDQESYKERFHQMCRTIGYILHNFKDPANPRAVILTDEVISDNPEGGVGKGVFLKGLSKIKNMVTMDGKNFNTSKSFLWQRVTLATQIIALEDVTRFFDFEKQFSMITEGIEVEKKNKDSFYIPYDKSPKVMITSNYVIQGQGSSHDRRRIEIELKQYYKPDFTPRDEFGHNLYDDWSNEEWNLFDNFMMWCVHQYLLFGVAKPVNKNLSLKKLKNSVPETFIEWFQVKEKELVEDSWYELNALANEFRGIDHDSIKVTNRKISTFIREFCNYRKWDYSTQHTKSGAQFMISKTQPSKK